MVLTKTGDLNPKRALSVSGNRLNACFQRSGAEPETKHSFVYPSAGTIKKFPLAGNFFMVSSLCGIYSGLTSLTPAGSPSALPALALRSNPKRALSVLENRLNAVETSDFSFKTARSI